MYLPYLRGKQYELLAIRELIDKDLISNKIFPVIEPIKLSSTLEKTINLAKSKKFKIALIFNPEVGDLKDKKDKIFEKYSNLLKDDFLFYGYITNINMQKDMATLKSKNVVGYDQILLTHTKKDFIQEYVDTFSSDTPAYNLIPDQRMGRKVKDGKILFADHFLIRKRNSDYALEPDEFFSDDHLYYLEEGFVGFSDYSTISSQYFSSGFLPRAVAIHIIYLDGDNVFRVKHFVSDYNDDISDTPRKFYEALEKLVGWKSDSETDTYALRIFQKHFDEQTYPGLGSLKKLSLMHHIELVDQFLKG